MQRARTIQPFGGNGGRRWLRAPLALLAAAGLAYLLWTAIGAPLHTPRLSLNGLTVDPEAPVRRDTTYQLVLWETALTIPKRPHGFRNDLGGALAEFRDRYPNVEVEVTFIPGDEVGQRLQEAIARGQPPDVVALREPVAGLDLQVPVDAYLPKPSPGSREGEAAPLYFAAAREPWTVGGRMWGFPRWIEWEAWAGDGERLRRWQVDVDGALRYGWTWDDVLALGRRMAREGVRGALALDGRDPSLFMQLVANAGAPWWERDGEGLWGAGPLALAAGFLQQLAAERALTVPAEGQAFNRVVRFLEGDGPVVGPVNAPLYAALQEAAGSGIVLLPVPHHPGHQEAALLVPSGYAVFRQEPFRGDAHLRAAMELAYFLSRRQGLSTAQKMGFLPASPRDLHPWQDRSGLHHLARNFLLDYLTHFPRPGGGDPGTVYLPPRGVRETVANALPALWANPPPAAEAWAEDLAQRLAAFRKGTGGRSTGPGKGAGPR